jgi:hypothetical protein
MDCLWVGGCESVGSFSVYVKMLDANAIARSQNQTISCS